VTLPFGVKAVFAPQQPADFRQIQPAQAEEILHCAVQMADYIVVDLPSHPCHVSQAAIRNCDIVAVVVERNPNCVAAGTATVELLKCWGISESAIAAVVVVRDALGDFIPPAELASRLGCPVAGVIPAAVELGSAPPKAGTPFSIFEPESILVANLTAQAEKRANGAAIAAPL
jgi:MinD-like ATPase involved in chromosome partitioning or flagellar assembly